MITCIHCRQPHSDVAHQCLEDMTLEEVRDLPEEVMNHLFRREYRARFLQALFEGKEEVPPVERLSRAELVDAIALGREKTIKDGNGSPALPFVLQEFDRMASGLMERLFPEDAPG